MAKYNNYKLFQIAKHMNYNPYYALAKLEDYIYEFHKDYYGYAYYLRILIDLGLFEEAKSVLDFIESAFPQLVDDYIIFHKLRLLLFTDNYEEAYNLYNRHNAVLLAKYPRTKVVEIIYEKFVNGVVNSAYSKNYLNQQIVNYSSDCFLEHMQKHMNEYNIDVENPNPVIFNPDFPLNEIVDEINRIVPNDNRTYFSIFYNFYVFKYDDNGKIDNKYSDYFRVVTIHNTNKIITMYPMQHGEALLYTDFNYLNTEKKVKTRKISRVDRFYQKYGNINK